MHEQGIPLPTDANTEFLQRESTAYAQRGRQNFFDLMNGERTLDSREIKQLLQMIAMEYMIETHREEILRGAIGQPSIGLPEEIFFAEHFAAKFDMEFIKDDGELSLVKTEIFSKRNAERAIQKLEQLMEQWWQEYVQKQVS